MLMNLKVGRRGLGSEPLTVYVVATDRAGNHKPPKRAEDMIDCHRFHYNVKNPVVSAKFKGKGGAKTLEAITLEPDAERKGYFMLEEAFKAEGMDAEWQEWLRYNEAIKAGQVSEPSFPDSLLPQRVRDAFANCRAKAPRRWKPDPDLVAKAKPAEPRAEPKADAKPEPKAKGK